nr:shewanella-like protein phosphatase 2 [Ziziphus jujuba var. spinosa]XP_048321359.1 shewanella-like protein phosphatase 2 [Ziziphus jujuba var. spinosa]
MKEPTTTTTTRESESESDGHSLCKDIPNLLSSFVETFVDFSVSGLFLLPKHPPNPLSSSSSPSSLPPLRTRYPPVDRLIALGDLHGDLDKTKQSLRLSGLIDASDRWVGGPTTLVQIGDVLDRGGDEIKILYFLEKLKREATKSGGNVICMNGNHEIMNIEGDFRFATKEGLEEFRTWAHWYSIGNQMKALSQGLDKPCDPFHGVPFVFRGIKEDIVEGVRARIAALRPRGPLSVRFLSENVTVVVVGESVFVHGGLLPEHVSIGLERMNEEVRDWIRGELKGKLTRAPRYCRGRDAVVWLRNFSHESASKCDCSALEHVLSTIPGAKRMIMGHTIQQLGINSVCDDRAIRIDVGMSRGCINGLPEVLEIRGNSQPRILTSNPLYQNKYKSTSSDNPLVLLPEHGHAGPKPVQVKA